MRARICVSRGARFIHPHMADYANLVRDLLEALDVNQGKLAERLGVSQGTVSRWLSGGKVDADNRERLDHLAAEVLRRSPRQTGRKVDVVGYAAAGGDDVEYSNGQGPFDEVNAPEWASDETVAVRIRGTSMGKPFAGWLAFYDDRRDPPDDSLYGRLCICGLADGRVVMKTLRKGSAPGLYHLESITEPTMFDVKVDWAAEVMQMRSR